MNLRWLRPFVVLSAALIVCISSIATKRPTTESLLWLLAVIIIFFFIGTVGTRIIQLVMSSASKEEIIEETEPVEEVADEQPEDKEDFE